MARLLNAKWESDTLGKIPGVQQKVGMMTSLWCAGLLCLTLFALVPATAQITITTADFSSFLSPGKTISSKTDTATKTANIGTLGATSWNFSALRTNFTSFATIVRPDTTPFSSYFPGSTIAERVGSGGATAYEYMTLGTNLLIQGTGLTGFVQSRIRNVPSAILYQLPMTMGTTWTTVYVESTMVALPPPLPPQITITNYTVSNTVDAYGSLTLPGGSVVEALRVKTDRRSTSGTHSTRSITYGILAANGATVSVVAADSLQPTSGTINASGISWNTSLTSDVRLSDAVPASFTLLQNYPNPFNPSTKIGYGIRDVRFVSLKIYDVLGKEVAALVNEVKQPGSYEVTFDATGLASGVYFYRLETGTFTDTKRLLLLR